MPWGEEHARSPEAERAAMVKDCVDAMRAALVVYDEAIRTIGGARTKIARTLLSLQGGDVDDAVPEIITFGPRSGRTQAEAEEIGRHRVAEDRGDARRAGVLILPDEMAFEESMYAEAVSREPPGWLVKHGYVPAPDSP